MKYVNELNSMNGRVRLTRAPSTLRYRIVDVDNSRTVLDWVTLTPAADVSFLVPASANSIFNDSRGKKKKTERRVLVVQADSGTDSQFNNEIEYAVRNQRGFES